MAPTKPRILVISGPIGAGKTELAEGLEARFGFARLSTSALLRQNANKDRGRVELQRQGSALDHETKGRWVSEAVQQHLAVHPPENGLVVDAARRLEQIEAIRERYGRVVVHVHLTAPDDLLRKKFEARGESAQSYAAIKAEKTEQQVETLSGSADLRIDTGHCTTGDVLVRVASYLNLYASNDATLVDVLIGGAYGSEGKGHIASFLASDYDVLVRVGGPNAGHKVYLNSGQEYTHHHLPSGTRFNLNARILIGPGAVVDPDKLRTEIDDCGLTPDRLVIDPHVMLITAQDRDREREIVAQIGSTGQGVGAATVRRIERYPVPALARDHEYLSKFVGATSEMLEDAYRRNRRVFLEGTQGTGLSLYHGSYPHVTSRDTSVSGCLSEAGIAPLRVRRIIMVARTYPIRVADPAEHTSGPLQGELTWDVVAARSRLDGDDLKRAEVTSTTGRDRRVGEFDWELLRRAAALNGPTDVALTFADYVSAANRDARRFEQLTPETIHFVEEVERVAGAPVSLISTRFHTRSIIDRRIW
jgi:adenylosuccinate synthase